MSASTDKTFVLSVKSIPYEIWPDVALLQYAENPAMRKFFKYQTLWWSADIPEDELAQRVKDRILALQNSWSPNEHTTPKS